MRKKSDHLESFIESHRDAFDDFEPSEALWHRIERGLPVNRQPAGKLVSVKKLLQIAVAAAILIGGIFIVYRLNRPSSLPHADLAKVDSIRPSENMLPPVAESTQTAVQPDLPVQQELASSNKTSEKVNSSPSITEEELYHYSKLIEIKQSQMEALKKTQPELYKEFAGDLEILETSYGALKHQLEEGVNNEKILEAMIGNLKMQSDLLNRQLEILKQVNKNKENNEKSYKKL